MSLDTKPICDDNAKIQIKEHQGDLTSLRESLQLYKGSSVRYYIKQLRPDLWESELKKSDEKSEQVSDKPIALGSIEAPDEHRASLYGKRFVVTVAQNNTHVHAGFLNALRAYCKDQDAKLLVTRCTYNKSGFQNLESKDEGLWYDPAIQADLLPAVSTMLCGTDMVMGSTPLVLCAELDVLPTATRPLSGLQNYTRGDSCIVPHVKIAMETIPTHTALTPSTVSPKYMFTTGAVTQRNYIQRKVGQKAEFHHVYGALVVEFDANGDWHVRQLVASTHGGFYDLTTFYGPDGQVSKGHRIESLVLGDMHLPHREYVREFANLTADGGILKALRPKRIFVHDAIDFHGRNHHNRDDGRHNVLLRRSPFRTVQEEMNKASQQLMNLSYKLDDCRLWLVWSNHMDALIRWVQECNWQSESSNAELLLKLQALMVGQRKMDTGCTDATDVQILRAALNLPDYANINILHRNHSCMIGDVEHAMHGHIGPNGARGNPLNLNNIGRKATIGHGHTARIVDGVYQVGVLCPLRLGYNNGPQSWSYTHCVQYPNGKRAMLTQKGDRWRR